MRNVVIDTDYFRFITMDCMKPDIFLRLMGELGCMPVMHEYVYRQELHEQAFIKQMVEDNRVKIFTYKQILEEIQTKTEYERLFRYAYAEMNFKEFSSDLPIECYHHDKENLGEIHSIIMARMLGMEIFMSNDGGARTFVEQKISTKKSPLRVIDIETTFTELIVREASNLSWKDLKPIIAQFRRNETDQKKYERIRNLWVD